MKEKTYVLNILLALLWGLQMVLFVVSRAFWPANILPAMDIPLLLGASLLALLAEHWLAPGGQRPWALLVLLAALTFGLLPLCAGLADAVLALKLAGAGGVTFGVSTALFDSMLSRLSSGKAAPVMAAFGLFLAGQCFTNIFF